MKVTKQNMNLKKTLDEYSKSNMYPFHMPGHKRNLDGVYKIDMTEVEGVDDLHDPSDVIAGEQEKMAKLFGADESFILVGGSTVGNLAAIYAACQEEDKIIIQRNSHRSVYNGAMIRHLKVEYLNPKLDEQGIYEAVTPEMVEKALQENTDAKAVVITSPTYEGYHANLEIIAKICHEKNICLIVDAAHGAHLGFHSEFKHRATEFADITVQSLHKTLPSLTQTAALHIKGKIADGRKIREALDIFETSSPSYVLMNSVSECLDYLEKSADSFDNYVENLKDFYSKCGELKHLKVVDEDSEIKDPGKIIISTRQTNVTGIELARILREKYELETEMSSFAYVLAMTSVMDTKTGFDRLANALIEIDKSLELGTFEFPSIYISPTKKMEMFEAKAKGSRVIDLQDSINHVSAAMVCLYPPGAPVLVPGELITTEALELIKKAKNVGIHVTGLTGNGVSVVN